MYLVSFPSLLPTQDNSTILSLEASVCPTNTDAAPTRSASLVRHLETQVNETVTVPSRSYPLKVGRQIQWPLEWNVRDIVGHGEGTNPACGNRESNKKEMALVWGHKGWAAISQAKRGEGEFFQAKRTTWAKIWRRKMAWHEGNHKYCSLFLSGKVTVWQSLARGRWRN